MNESTQFSVNSSSIIDLKAELYRKQESFRLKKLSQSQQQIVNNSDNNLYSINTNINNNSNNKYKLGKRIREKVSKSGLKFNEKKQIHINLEENHKLNEEKLEEEKALKKSREMLEKKTKLYEEMSNNIKLCLNSDDEELDDRILVNFEQKAIEKQNKQINDSMKKSETIEDLDNETNCEDDWTEFVDSLGRSRKCLKKDLQHFEELDRQTFEKYNSINNNKSQVKSSNLSTNISSVPHLSRNNELLSNDLIRELDRREWESNASNEMNSEFDGQESDGSIHYQNVKHNEIRDHGVGYYSFSKDSHQREEQMDLLNNLRQQTESQKIAKNKLKEKRKLLMRERLAKIAQRKGISVDFTQSSDSEQEIEPEPMPQEKPPISKPITVREWDIGKEDLVLELPMSKSNSNSYIEQLRVERNPDFAPPSSYNKNQFRYNSSDNRSHYKSQNLKNQQIHEKTINMDNKSDQLFDNNNISTTPPKPDVNQIITNALSFFRNNSK